MQTITLLRSITMLCGIESSMQDILHIHTKCEEYYVEYYHSHIILLWIWNIVMTTLDYIRYPIQCTSSTPKVRGGKIDVDPLSIRLWLIPVLKWVCPSIPPYRMLLVQTSTWPPTHAPQAYRTWKVLPITPYQTLLS